jgi:hypothetical protein
MQVALVTDTFPPDLNGVSLTMDRLRRGLEARGHRVNVIRPSGGPGPLRLRRRETGVRSLPVPGYPGLRFEELLTSASCSPSVEFPPYSTAKSAS